MRREMRSLRPPPFGEEICCLAGFLGEAGDLGYGPGLDGRAESREIVARSRTNYGRNFRHVSESRSGLIMGDFEHGARDDPVSIHKGSDRTERHE